MFELTLGLVMGLMLYFSFSEQLAEFQTRA